MAHGTILEVVATKVYTLRTFGRLGDIGSSTLVRTSEAELLLCVIYFYILMCLDYSPLCLLVRRSRILIDRAYSHKCNYHTLPQSAYFAVDGRYCIHWRIKYTGAHHAPHYPLWGTVLLENIVSLTGRVGGALP